jgi:transcription-repair coupling factor (superfamily II helicase)
MWLVIHEEAARTDALAEDLALFHAARGARIPVEILTFPEAQTDNREMREAFNAASDRLAVLSRLRGIENVGRVPPMENADARGVRAPRLQSTLVVLTTPAALLQPVPPLADFAERESTLLRGETRPFQGLLELLRSFDYDSEAVCEAPGQYAVRGGIVDVYPITAHQPYRLDFFGDTLEEIKTLDPVTQRSGESVERITLTAAPRLHTRGTEASLLDYLGAAAQTVIIEPRAVEEIFDLQETGARTPLGAEPETAARESAAAEPGAGTPATLPLLRRRTSLFAFSASATWTSRASCSIPAAPRKHGTRNPFPIIAPIRRTDSWRTNGCRLKRRHAGISWKRWPPGTAKATRLTWWFQRRARSNACANCSRRTKR